MSNYSPQDAINSAQEFVKGIPIDTTIGPQIADIIQTTIWNFYPWQFSIKKTTKVGGAFLTDGVQDISGVPADMKSLIWCRLTRTDLPDGKRFRELTPVERLDPFDEPVKFDYTLHEFIAYVPEVPAFRLETPLRIQTGTELTQLDIEYQQIPTKLISSNLSTSFPLMTDWYFNTFFDGILWRLYVFANDRRQGGMQINKQGMVTYTGQMGCFYNSLIEQAQMERARYVQLRYPADGGSIGGSRAPRTQGGWFS